MKSKILLTVVEVAILVSVLLLAGCGSVSVKTPDGFEFQSRTLWKDVEAANFQSEDFIGELGSSTSAEQASALILVCTINPSLPMCHE